MIKIYKNLQKTINVITPFMIIANEKIANIVLAALASGFSIIYPHVTWKIIRNGRVTNIWKRDDKRRRYSCLASLENNFMSIAIIGCAGALGNLWSMAWMVAVGLPKIFTT